MSKDYPGIDYGGGTTNIDKETGIRYGVIPQNDVLQNWADAAEADYGEPHCPKCGNVAVAGDSEIPLDELANGETEEELQECDRDELGYETLHHACGDYACDSCRVLFDAEDAYGDTPNAWILDDGEYKATCGDDGDIFILKSPYYTFAQFCSPCAPGAGYLRNPVKDGPKTYCFAADWFDDSIEPCPYPVYRVDNNECVYTPKQTE
jgi:hypothetical protein